MRICPANVWRHMETKTSLGFSITHEFLVTKRENLDANLWFGGSINCSVWPCEKRQDEPPKKDAEFGKIQSQNSVKLNMSRLSGVFVFLPRASMPPSSGLCVHHRQHLLKGWALPDGVQHVAPGLQPKELVHFLSDGIGSTWISHDKPRKNACFMSVLLTLQLHVHTSIRWRIPGSCPWSPSSHHHP